MLTHTHSLSSPLALLPSPIDHIVKEKLLVRPAVLVDHPSLQPLAVVVRIPQPGDANKERQGCRAGSGAGLGDGWWVVGAGRGCRAGSKGSLGMERLPDGTGAI
jgi:hypothetical protein